MSDLRYDFNFNDVKPKIEEKIPKKKGFTRGSSEILIRQTNSVYRRAYFKKGILNSSDDKKGKEVMK